MRRLILFVLASAFAGCTLLTAFNPEGQPCDLNQTDVAVQCLSDAGYWCVSGACRKGPPPGKSDGGSTDGG